MEELRDYLQKKYNELICSPYEADKLYENIMISLFASAAGYDPDARISDVYEMIKEIVK